MLTRCLPTWVEDPERFWELKRKGELTALPPAAGASVPEPLLGVVRRAMAPDRAARYQSVAEFRAALLEYQRHDESAALAQSAVAAAAEAGRAGDYAQFASVTARLTHALEMWPENAQARAGLLEARRGYALCALEHGDLALADSVVGNAPVAGPDSAGAGACSWPSLRSPRCWSR